MKTIMCRIGWKSNLTGAEGERRGLISASHAASYVQYLDKKYPDLYHFAVPQETQKPCTINPVSLLWQVS